MPLHPKEEGLLVELEALRGTVLRPCDNVSLWSLGVDCLVVKRVHPAGSEAEDLGQSARLRNAYVVDGGVRGVATRVEDGLGGVVLDVAHERAAEGHVHDLHAAADAKYRDVSVPARTHERPLKGVACGAGKRDGRMAFRGVSMPVKGVIGNVAAAREEDAVETADDVRHERRRLEAKRDAVGERHRDSAGIGHRCGVVVIGHGPVWVLGVLPRPRRNSDERPCGSDWHVSSPLRCTGGIP